jgi:nucleoside-triphosphatase
MKILLTGLPKSGKTTLLVNLIADIRSKHGMVAQEVLEGDVRVGFDLIDEIGCKTVLSRVDKRTNYPVGRYFVDVDSLDEYIGHLFHMAGGQLLYIDEIGQMQLYSENFRNLVNTYLNLDNDYIGTISAVFSHPFIDEVKRRSDVLLCIVTPENRQELDDVLSGVLATRNLFNNLPAQQQSIVLELARHYLQAEQYISLKKLFRNALRYIAEHKVTKAGDDMFSVDGNHGQHLISKTDQKYRCDCDFFNGRKQFESQPGECSHVQSVKVLFGAIE